MNIEDGIANSNFPKLKKMKSTDIDKRFQDYGFWFCSDDNIITKAKERYWDREDPQKIDNKSKNNPKELRWEFSINESKLKKNRIYKVTYVMSIPGMFPVNDGYYNKYLRDEKFHDESILSSSMCVEHSIKKLKYIISFENGIKLDEMPRCEVNKRLKNNIISKKIVHGEEENNYIFDKYSYTIKKPRFQSKVKISWGIEEKPKK